MDCLKHYNRLVARGKLRSWTKESAPCYTEWHHIVPKCIVSDNRQYNLVLLTAEEHFVAHQLLVKIYADTKYKYKVAYAADAMRLVNRRQFRSMNKEIGWLKRRSAEAKSMVHSGKTVSAATRQKLRTAHKKENLSASTLHKMSVSSKRENLSRETRRKMSEAANHRSDEVKRKNSEGQKRLSVLTCPHCTLSSRGRGNMKRYHFDNCKYKKE